MTEFDTSLAKANSSIKHLMRWFMSSTLILGLGAGGWAAVAKIDSAVITEGTFAVPSSAQAVQHLEGGLIGAILVKEGDLVHQGQVLARLDAARVLSDMSILKRKLIDLTAEQTRLQAERDDQETMQRPALPADFAAEATDLALALTAQQTLLLDRRSARESQLSQLDERKRQIETQIEGLTDQRRARSEELTQIMGDLTDQRKLDAQRLIRRSVLRQTEREAARARGEIGDMDARMASSRSQLAETAFHINETKRQVRSEILSRLQAVVSQLAETTDQLATARDRMQRLDIRAPRTGFVHELTVHTIGGTIGAGQALMSIIPNNEPLLVAAKIRPEDIDQIFVGQAASVRITSFKMAITPELTGQVTSISPDQVVDEKSGRGYFTAKIAVAAGERSKLDGKELVPGLPAEVLILGESRRVISYLTQPLTDKLGLAFREK